MIIIIIIVVNVMMILQRGILIYILGEKEILKNKDISVRIAVPKMDKKKSQVTYGGNMEPIKTSEWLNEQPRCYALLVDIESVLG